MDKMPSSIRQVPTQLPRVLSRRATGGGDPDGFERSQTVSVNKAINSQEVPVKEKHARNILYIQHPHTHTHSGMEKGAHTFWSVVNRLPLSSNAVLSWKFCHVFHKLLRDGHHNVLKDSLRYKSELNDMGRMWGHLNEGYGRMVSMYVKLLITKMDFHIKNPAFPGNLMMTDAQLEATGENDVNNFFQLTVEMFDYLECELILFNAVFSSMDMSRPVSMTTAGQCRLAPLIPVVLDCSHLYDYIVKLLFKLHSCLPADTLQGHRDRFLEQFKKLKEYLHRSSNLQYFKRLIQIPQLPEIPPNFLRASALSEHVSPVVVIPEESASPDSEAVLETDDLVDTDSTSTQSQFDDRFDDLFGSSTVSTPFNFNSQNGVSRDERDKLIEQLYREINALKEELDTQRLETERVASALRSRLGELEAELAEARHLRGQAWDETEFLRTELEDVKRRSEDTEKTQKSLTEIEKRAQANEQRYNKLKEKYTGLVQNHADLLRKNAEVARQLTTVRQAKEEAETARQQLQSSMQSIMHRAEEQVRSQSEGVEQLQQELETGRQAVASLKETLRSSQEASSELSARLTALEAERADVERVSGERASEVQTLQSRLDETLSTSKAEAERSEQELSALQSQLSHKVEQESMLKAQLLADQKALLDCAMAEAEHMVQSALEQLDDPAHMGCTASPDYLISRAQCGVDSTDRLKEGHSQFLADSHDASGLLGSVAAFAHVVSDVIVQGTATSHASPIDQADKLSDLCRHCGTQALTFLGSLKDSASAKEASPNHTREALLAILAIAQELRPRGLDVKPGELGDLVEQEMAATAAAIEDAAARIEDMLSKARAEERGVKLEVNERFVSRAMMLLYPQTIRALILASKDLQKEIVDEDRGATSQKEFYAKNSRWTEGLISASKAVGWAATMLVDAADQVLKGNGKFEELMVCSREIAASTAQLVAASKVKANKGSTNLQRLQQASRTVNEATASVVASTKSGKAQIEEKETMDFSSMTLTQVKRQEMDSQVRVLELESLLQKEREHLGGLRKKHYELAGVSEGWDEEGSLWFVTDKTTQPLRHLDSHPDVPIKTKNSNLNTSAQP
ncbi:unnamed protein product [Lampetra fluviatilis]